MMAGLSAMVSTVAVTSALLSGVPVAYAQGTVNTTGSAAVMAPGTDSIAPGSRARGNTVGSAAGVANGPKGPAEGDIDVPSVGTGGPARGIPRPGR